MNPAAVFREDILAPFDRARFGIERLPVPVRRMGQRFGADLPCCLDMLIRLPGQAMAIPEPYRSCAGVREFIELAMAYETRVNTMWQKCYAYLTVDQRVVAPGRTHRNAGWHFDGMQGARYPQKLPACHQYIVSDALSTEFAGVAVDARGLSETQDNWFIALGGQVEWALSQADDGGRPCRRWWSTPYEVLAMSAYQMHRSPRAILATRRTFVRLDISHKQQDRLGNSVNPELVTPWKFVPRGLPESVSRPIEDTGWEERARATVFA